MQNILQYLHLGQSQKQVSMVTFQALSK